MENGGKFKCCKHCMRKHNRKQTATTYNKATNHNQQNEKPQRRFRVLMYFRCFSYLFIYAGLSIYATPDSDWQSEYSITKDFYWRLPLFGYILPFTTTCTSNVDIMWCWSVFGDIHLAELVSNSSHSTVDHSRSWQVGGAGFGRVEMIALNESASLPHIVYSL